VGGRRLCRRRIRADSHCSDALQHRGGLLDEQLMNPLPPQRGIKKDGRRDSERGRLVEPVVSRKLDGKRSAARPGQTPGRRGGWAEERRPRVPTGIGDGAAAQPGPDACGRRPKQHLVGLSGLRGGWFGAVLRNHANDVGSIRKGDE